MNMATIKTMVNSSQISQQPSVDILRGDQIQIEPIGWLWNGWLACGKLHILAGIAGTGKTTIALSLGAAITSGSRWPDGSPALQGDIVIWSGEDDPADTLAPRLNAMGADMSRVHFVNGVKDGELLRSFDPAKDIEILSQAIEGICPALIIVDPIVSAVAADSHNNAETRRALQPLVDMAAKAGAALLGISHFSKGSMGRNPTERVTGSLAFGALARVVMAASKISDDKGGGRLFCRAKSNIGADDGGFHYDLQQAEVSGHANMVASCVVWGEAVDGSAQTLLTDAETVLGEGNCLDEAKAFLEIELGDGPVAVNKVYASAKQAGITKATVRRAKEALGVKSEKSGMETGWYWVLRPKTLNNAEDAHPC